MKIKLFIILMLVLILTNNVYAVEVKYYNELPDNTPIRFEVYLNGKEYKFNTQIINNTATISFDSDKIQYARIVVKYFDVTEEYNVELNDYVILKSYSYKHILTIKNADIYYDTAYAIYYNESDFISYLNSNNIQIENAQAFDTNNDNVKFYFSSANNIINASVKNTQISYQRISYYASEIKEIFKTTKRCFVDSSDSEIKVYCPNLRNYQKVALQLYNDNYISAVIEIQNTSEPQVVDYNDFIFKIALFNKQFFINMLQFKKNGYLYVEDKEGNVIYDKNTNSDEIAVSIDNSVYIINTYNAYSYTFIKFDNVIKNDFMSKLITFINNYIFIVAITVLFIVGIILRSFSAILIAGTIITVILSLVYTNFIISAIVLLILLVFSRGDKND